MTVTVDLARTADVVDVVDAVVGCAERSAWTTRATLAALACAIAEHAGAPPPPGCEGAPTLPAPLLAPHGEQLTPHLVGAVYERLLHPTTRRVRGAHFTPPDVAAALVAFALRDRTPVELARVCDPACGGGVFLLAAAEWLEARGVARDQAARAMHGIDIDPLAAWVTATALELWSPGCDAATRVRCADALDALDALDAIDGPAAGAPFDAVLGNPPFQNQLQTTTARSAAAHAGVAARLGGARAAYLDTAALFLVRGLELVRDGGVVALVQPHSTLVARDAAVVRARCVDHGALAGLWFATEPIFAASVRVCAPVLERRSAPPAAPRTTTVRRAVGRAFVDAAPVDPPVDATTWAPLVGDLLGVPAVHLVERRRLGAIATATAGFRDEYYGLVPAVHERAAEAIDDGTAVRARLGTCGLVDVLHLAWGEHPVTFAKQRVAAPVVDLDRLDARVGAWVRAQLVPKVLVATQSKVIEAVVDEHGDVVPSTPLIAVHAPPDRLWHVAAVLTAPCISAHALARVAGAALSAQGIKLAARQVLELPLPVDQALWDTGARLAALAQRAEGDERDALLDELGRTMDAAYAVHDHDVFAWWRARRTGRRR